MNTTTAPGTRESSITVRIPADVHKQLSQLAKATGRTKSFYVVDTLKDRIELDLWQIEQTRQAIIEADNGEFASESELAAVSAKYGN